MDGKRKYIVLKLYSHTSQPFYSLKLRCLISLLTSFTINDFYSTILAPPPLITFKLPYTCVCEASYIIKQIMHHYWIDRHTREIQIDRERERKIQIQRERLIERNIQKEERERGIQIQRERLIEKYIEGRERQREIDRL